MKTILLSLLGFATVGICAAPLGALEGTDLLTGAAVPILGATKQPTVVVFMSARCPCSKSHEAVLKALAATHPQLRFVGIHSNQDEPESEAKTHFAEVGFSFPVLQDKEAKIATALNAFKTPHSFILDAGGNKLFSGGVDDSHLAQNAKTKYLAAALDSVVAGKKPDPSEVRTIGCTIQR